jgi:hypothetical protein
MGAEVGGSKPEANYRAPAQSEVEAQS